MISLRRAAIRFITRHLEFAFVRKLYRDWMFVSNYLRYGDSTFPRMMSIEISTHCNRACTYCPNVVLPQKPRLIKEEVFQKFVERLAEIRYNGVVDFIFFSEPTLHPRLAEFVKILKAKVPSAIPRICTNGDLLTTERVTRYLDAGMDRIYVMRHVPTPEGWRENIDKLDTEFPGVFVKMDIEELESKNGLNNFGGVVSVKKVMQGETNADGSPSCRVHTHVAQFTVDGEWDLCCTDFGKTHQFGNIMTHSLMDIWRSPGFVKMRTELRGGVARLPVCKTCFVFANNPKYQASAV